MVSKRAFLREPRKMLRERSSVKRIADAFYGAWRNNEFPDQSRWGPVIVTYLEEMLSMGRGEEVVEFVADQADVPKNDAAKFIQMLGAETAGDAERVNSEYSEWRTSSGWESGG